MGPLILMLHSPGSSGGADFATVLSTTPLPKVRLLALDLPCHGQSVLPCCASMSCTDEDTEDAIKWSLLHSRKFTGHSSLHIAAVGQDASNLAFNLSSLEFPQVTQLYLLDPQNVT